MKPYSPTRATLLVALLLLVCASHTTALNTVRGNVFINDSLRAKQLIVNSDGIHTEFSQDLDTAESGLITSNAWCETASLDRIQVDDKLICEHLSTRVIRGKANTQNPELSGTITIEGQLSLTENMNTDGTISTPQISLLESKSISVNGVSQWSLVETETFSFSKAQSNSTLLQNGWKVIKRDSQQQLPLKTDDSEQAVAALGEEIMKTFDDIPEHSFMKIEANFYFLSPFWKGETAQIRVDGKLVWLDSHEWTDEVLPSGVETICDFRVTDLNSFVWVYPVSFVLKHSKPSFTIELGLSKTLDSILACKESSNGSDKLDSIPLFGFDDFSLYVK